MTSDHDSALYELAIIVAEAAVDAWVADEIADKETEVTSDLESIDNESKSKRAHKALR